MPAKGNNGDDLNKDQGGSEGGEGAGRGGGVQERRHLTSDRDTLVAPSAANDGSEKPPPLTCSDSFDAEESPAEGAALLGALPATVLRLDGKALGGISTSPLPPSSSLTHRGVVEAEDPVLTISSLGGTSGLTGSRPIDILAARSGGARKDSTISSERRLYGGSLDRQPRGRMGSQWIPQKGHMESPMIEVASAMDFVGSGGGGKRKMVRI